MSYSAKVKEELADQMTPARHCQLSELAAIFRNCGKINKDKNGTITLGFRTENRIVARKYFTLLKKVYTIDTNIWESMLEEKEMEFPEIVEKNQVNAILKSLHFMDESGLDMKKTEKISDLLLKRACCKRAFLRGSFLTSGSMSDPEKGYHLEFVCISKVGALQLQEILSDFDIEAKIIERKKYFVTYIKEGEAIVNLLNVMEAHISLMDFENLRIVRDVRNQVNRRVNCEAANIMKTVTAATRQREDILWIREHGGLEKLPSTLREIAGARLEYPDHTLKELGELFDPPIGKSGVNHRLRKISEIANKERFDR